MVCLTKGGTAHAFDRKVVDVGTDYRHSCVIEQSGKLTCEGWFTTDLQGGQPVDNGTSLATLVKGINSLSGERALRLQTGYLTSCVVTDLDHVYCGTYNKPYWRAH